MKEDLKREIEKNGLVCDCGGKVYGVGTGAIENQSNYNKYFEYLECFKCRKLYYLWSEVWEIGVMVRRRGVC